MKSASTSTQVAVVDASVWVSRLVSADVHHSISQKWLEAFVAGGGQCVAPVLLLAEVAGAISRRTTEPRLGQAALKLLLRMPALRIVNVERRLGMSAAQLAADLGLRGADAVYVALAQQLKVPLITWDQEQIDQTSSVIAARQPT
jgi:predicted nucleic acid-binding protein